MGRPASRACLAGFAILWTLGQPTHLMAQDESLATELQTLLAEKGCYRSSIDGVWGRMSQQALGLILDAMDDQNPVPDTELVATRDNIERVRSSGLRCVPRDPVAGPQPATTPRHAPNRHTLLEQRESQERRETASTTPRSLSPFANDCPGPGCPLDRIGAGSAGGAGWSD